MQNVDAANLRKTIFASALIFAILFSGFVGITQADFWLPNFSIYDNTTIYGADANITITVNLQESKSNNVTADFLLKIYSSIKAPAGNMVNPTQYLTQRSQNLFDCYLYSGFILDYDRKKIIDAVWLNWGKLGEAYDEYTELLPQSHDAILSRKPDSYCGTTNLYKLSEGVHNLTVWVRAEQNYLSFDNPIWAAFPDTITFNIDTTAPKISVLSPQDSVYQDSDIPLNFIANEPLSKVAYCLDGKDNITINGNTTMAGLANGNHNVIVYSTDEFGNMGFSEVIYFTIQTPLSLLLVASASIASAALVGMVLLVYLRRHNHGAGTFVKKRDCVITQLLFKKMPICLQNQ
jgi:hypothetical protein